MQIFIDFDDVLFNTGEFNVEFEKVFDRCGVDNKLFQVTYKEARERDGIANYSFDRHCAILEKDHNISLAKINDAVVKLLNHADQFVFTDAEHFLKKLQADDHELYLVSFGAPSIQEGKVCGSGLREYFKKIIVGEISKGEKIKEVLGAGNGKHYFFLDDRVEHITNVKENCSGILTILVERPEGRYHDDRMDSCDFTAESLNDVEKIIKRFS